MILSLLIQTLYYLLGQDEEDPYKPQFYYIKWGLRGYILHGHVFLMGLRRACHFLSKTSQIIFDLHPGFSHMEDEKGNKLH